MSSSSQPALPFGPLSTQLGSSAPKRTAPKCGYDTETKAAYRDQSWREYAKAIPNLGDGKVVLLPSSEGVELNLALRLKVPRENIVVFDRDESVIQSSRWRTKHPDIEAHAVRLSDLHQRLGDRPVTVANLDLCGQLSGETIAQFKSFIDKATFSDVYYIGFTVAKGRESSLAVALIRDLETPAEIKCSRMAAVWYTLRLDERPHTTCQVVAQGTYRAGKGTQTMSWAVFRFERLKGHTLSLDFGSVHSHQVSVVQCYETIKRTLDERRVLINRKERKTWTALDLQIINYRDDLKSHPIMLLTPAQERDLNRRMRALAKEELKAGICNGHLPASLPWAQAAQLLRYLREPLSNLNPHYIEDFDKRRAKLVEGGKLKTSILDRSDTRSARYLY